MPRERWMFLLLACPGRFALRPFRSFCPAPKTQNSFEGSTSMSQNIFALRQRQIELKAEGDGIFAAARNGFSPRQRTRLDTLKSELAEVQSEIQQRDYEIASDLDPNAVLSAAHYDGTLPTPRGKGTTMHNSSSSKIYNKLSDQLLASD